MVLRCDVVILQCDVMLLQCDVMILQCDVTILQCDVVSVFVAWDAGEADFTVDPLKRNDG